MKKTTKIINEGFMRKYMKEDLQDKIKTDIKRVLKQYGYNTSVDGADNYISAVADYIDMSREYMNGDYSVEDWLHDTELNYPEELEFMKSMNESTELNLGPLSFKSDIGTKVIDNADKISKTISTLSPLLADDASEKEEIKSKEVFHNDNGQDYDVIERSSSGKNALLKRGNKWIVAWNCPKDSGSWGQGHYFFDEESARKVWKDKYLNESLKKINFNNDPGFLDDLEASYKNAVEAGLEGSELEKELIDGFLKNERYKGFYFPASIKSKVKEFIRNKKTNESLNEESVRKVWKNKYKNESLQEVISDSDFNDPIRFKISIKPKDTDNTERANKFFVRGINNCKLHPEILIDNSDGSYEICVPGKNDWIDLIKGFCEESIYDIKVDLNESLEENDYFDFNSDIYNALSEVMFKYRDKNVDEVDLDKALNWFADRFFEFEFEESLKKCINRLNEAEMSDEDKHDSEILWNIYNKTQRRANAALTPEEKEILKKYNLERDSDYKNINKLSSTPGHFYDGTLVNSNISAKLGRSRSNTRQSDINLADRAKKISNRGNYGYRSKLRDFAWNSDIEAVDDHREYMDPETGRYKRIKDKGLLDAERRDQNVRMTDPVADMKTALQNRKYYSKNVAANNAKYDAEREKIQQEYEKKLADNEKNRKWSGENNQNELDNVNKTINKLLKRDTDK